MSIGTTVVDPLQAGPADEDLARETQAGSLTAFEALTFRYERRIYRFAKRFGLGEADLAEVTQDTFVSAYRGMAAFDCRRSFRAWLFAIARRKCLDRLRSFRREPPTAECLELVHEETPSDTLLRQEAEQGLWTMARRALSPRQFEVLWLRYAEDLEMSEIACVLGLTIAHVKVLLFRARREMLAVLKTPDRVWFPLGGRPASAAYAYAAALPTKARP